MFKNILIATDGSDLAAKAVEQGVLFPKEIGAGITALTITEPFNVLSLAPSERRTDRAAARLLRLMYTKRQD